MHIKQTKKTTTHYLFNKKFIKHKWLKHNNIYAIFYTFKQTATKLPTKLYLFYFEWGY